ncbi:MAG: non-canonical purine NTP pyrophosphatase [Halobacteriovoraceae bacterium]|nr:non-canonical purine NTP pyrophosphatase [Halobacteriovoraceae bacterium]
MSIILASQNEHKVKEIQEYLGRIISLKKAPEALEVIEDGQSFQENALKKAQAYYDKFQTPTLSDDSGLILEAFPEILGIHSARFAPEFPEYSDKCQRVLDIYQEKKESYRQAYFICVLCYYLSPQEIYFFEGKSKGVIAEKLRGEGGFGYDPIFLPDAHPQSKSFAEDPEWKDSHSHRAKALESFREFLKTRS